MAVTKLHGSWWVDFCYQGHRLRRRCPLNTRASALAFEVQLRQLVTSNGSIKDALAALTAKPVDVVPLFAVFSERWLREYVDVNNGRSERYNKRKSLHRRLVPFFGPMRLDEISLNAVERFKGALLGEGLNPKTVNNHLTVLNRCLGSARDWDVIATVPRIRLLKTVPPPFKFLSPDEVETLLASVGDSMLRAMIRMATRAGLRYSELRALHWEDVDFERQQITVRRAFVLREFGPTKNYRVRHIPMTPDLVLELRGLRRPSGLVFIVRASNWRQLERLKRACDEAGVPVVGWHSLRHTFASHMMAAGAPVHAVQELLGHSSVEMTLRYTHLMPSTLRSAIALLNPSVNSPPTGRQQQQFSPAIAATTELAAARLLPSTQQKDAASQQRLSMVAGGGFEPLSDESRIGAQPGQSWLG